ncbi:lysophospholipid acyltransferase family protein [Kordiimonas pumila]|uniref:Lysophospholipid acyltransferase family protein n=1 Tax=Kordiimonas pumila TaxID=2161677 RepID=A0ABV7D5R6_9PROT|nr:1-acyl-sn-glycerol-3-phosphate acyltransferase [Kordiimonas pumila]
MMRWLDPIRSVFFNIVFYSFTILFLGLAVLPLCYFKSEKRVRRMVGVYCSSSLWIARWIMGIKAEYRGLENYPKEGGFILAAAHQSNADAIMTFCLRSDVTALAKKELFSTPIVGRILAKMQVIRIDREARHAHKGMTEVGNSVVEMGRPLIVYPQATRIRIGQQAKKLKSGAYFLQQETGLRVVPVATNTGLFWRKSFWHRSGTMVFDIGAPIPEGLDKDAFMAQLETWIVDRSNMLVIEQGFGHLLEAKHEQAEE